MKDKCNLVFVALLTLFLSPLKTFAQFSDWTVYTAANSELPNNTVNAIAVDEMGTIWIGTQAGLAHFDGINWTIYTPDNSGIPDNRITSVAIDKGQIVWAGTRNGLARFDGSTWMTFTTSNSDIPHNRIRSLAVDQSGNVLVGTVNGLAKFDGSAWTVYTSSNSDLPDNDIESLAAVANGDVWIGTDAGLARFTGAAFTIFTTDNTPLLDDDIDALAVENSAVVWVGTERGLARYDGTNWAVYDTSNSELLDDHIEALALDRGGIVWIGTKNGFASFDNAEFTVYTTHNSGLPNDVVKSIDIDANGFKWIGTELGLAKFAGGMVNIIQVTAPNGGEIWRAEQTFTIEWETKEEVSQNVKIELYNGSDLVQTIAPIASNTGSYDWTVPADQVRSSEYRIKISDTNNPDIFDFSDSFFTIVTNNISDTFIRITLGDIVNNGGISLSSSWGDYDNDRDIDLFVANEGDNFLYRNKGDGTFTRITIGDIVNDGGQSHSATWGDFDNDDDLDLFVANGGGENNFLYENNGNSSFTRVTTGIVVNDGGDSEGASWVDFDNDGYLDLFVTNRGDESNFLYQNNGNRTFTKILDGDIVNDGGDSKGCNWGDIDNDGDLDLFVANQNGENNFLYTNNGDGTFTKVTEDDIVNDGADSKGASWGDYDNDGDLDLFVTNSGNNFLYVNSGSGMFTRSLSGPLVSDEGQSVGSSWGDFDNDTDLDLFVANADSQNNFLYTNNGDGTFTRITEGEIVSDGGNSAGTSWGDFDGDGDLDIFVANQVGDNFLYLNNGNNNYWIDIKLIGQDANAAGIGAKVSVLTNSVWQMQEISTQTGFGGQNSLNVEFGLGEADVIDLLKIEWPSGKIQTIPNCPANNQIILSELPEREFAIEKLNSNLYENNTVGQEDGTLYWYFKVLDKNGNPVDEDQSIDIVLSSSKGGFNPVEEVFPNGILRLEVDMNSTNIQVTDSALVEFPDYIVIDNQKATLSSKPDPVWLKMQLRAYKKSWDFYAGASLGASAIVGGVGAGASAAAARLSVKGVGGVGMTIATDQNDIIQIDRRFEAGIGVGVAVPSVNAVVGKVNVGASAELIAKGMLGQSMLFDNALDPEMVKMAKTGYTLETLSLGGATLSPIAGVILNAIVFTLNEFSGVKETFNDFLLEEFYGLGLEGSVGFEVGAELGDDSPIGLTLVGGQEALALQAKYILGNREPLKKKFSFVAALNYKLDVGTIKIKTFDKNGDKIPLGGTNFTLFSIGEGMSIGQTVTFNPMNEPIAYQIDLEGFGSIGAAIGDVSGGIEHNYLTQINIPEKILDDLISQANNELTNLTKAYDNDNPLEKVSFRVGPVVLVNRISALIDSFAAPLSTDDKPVTISVIVKRGFGGTFSLNVKFDVAVLVGGGLDLGVEFKQRTTMESLKKKAILLDLNESYLVESFANDLGPFEGRNLNYIMLDLFDGIDELVLAALSNFIQEIVELVEAAKEFAKMLFDDAAKIAGQLQQTGKLIIKKFSSLLPKVFFKAFAVPEVKQMYTSNKIAHKLPNGSLRRVSENATLYIVTDNFALNFEPEGGGLVDTFDSELTFSITVQEDQLINTGFSVADKDKIRMYQYVDSSMTWIRLEDDLNASIDTVASKISKPGSYALGIEVNPEDDKEPPLLNDISPENGATVSPLPLFSVRIIDQIIGSGVAVSKSKLILDDVVLDAIWAPTENELFFQVKDSLSLGSHTFRIIGVDTNGNTASEQILFNVGMVDNVDEAIIPRKFEILQNFPNPFNLETKIKYYIPNNGKVEVNIYNVNGRYVKSVINEFQTAGEHLVVWDGTDKEGRIVASGVYFYQVKYGDFNFVKRMTLLK